MLIDLAPQHYKVMPDGILYAFDPVRIKWLSVFRYTYKFSLSNSATAPEQWLDTSEGLPSNLTGYPIYKDQTIVSVGIEVSETSTGGLYINSVSSGIESPMVDLVIDSALQSSILDANIDLSAGVALTAKTHSGSLNYPVLLVETALLF